RGSIATSPSATDAPPAAGRSWRSTFAGRPPPRSRDGPVTTEQEYARDVGELFPRRLGEEPRSAADPVVHCIFPRHGPAPRVREDAARRRLRHGRRHADLSRALPAPGAPRL